MKKLIFLTVVIVALGLIVTGCIPVVPPTEQNELDNKAKPECDTIQDGVLTYSAGHYLAGQPLIPGYDPFGYNYQAHMFRGSYANAYLGRPGAGFPPYEGDDEAYLEDNPEAVDHWTWPYRNVQLIMKWNDAWLSNKDCGTQVEQAGYTDLFTPDGKLDRHYPSDSYIGSGAWVTNHQSGECVENDKTSKWTYFVKIVAVPEGATDLSGEGKPAKDELWFTADGVEIGVCIWGSFAKIQQVSNDSCFDEHGILYNSPVGPGFGVYK